MRFSGETEASSEPSVDDAGRGSIEDCTILPSSTSVRTCDTSAGLGPVFFRMGFEMGELLTFDLALAFAALFFRAFFDRSSPVPWLTGGWGSRAIALSIAAGECSIGELFEWVLWSYADELSPCARKAGDVRGLKYAPGTVKPASILK